jgi:membrane-bound lytic murein transglycosylase D
MSQEWLNKFRSYKSFGKSLIFVAGAVFGFSLSLIIDRIPDVTFDRTVDTVVKESDEPVGRKIDPLENISLPHNKRIEQRINYFSQQSRKADIVASYQRSGKYLPTIIAIFEEYNLPLPLAFLPILESRFIPESQSRVGAVGLWQIMPATASDYGLKYNRWIDERRDPEKSTVAAAEFLQFLYDKLQDWDLVLAAYNYGYSNLRRAMRRDRAADFWKIRRIPRETYNFVPNFYAILHLISDPEKYGISMPDKNPPLEYEVIDIEATFSIDQIARLADISAGAIKQYNPALIGGLAPSGTYSVKVPVGVKDHFLQKYEENPPDRVEITYTTYRVRRGDTLAKIARKFSTTVSALRADNNIRSSRWIRTGARLRIATVKVIKESISDEQIAEITSDADLDVSNKLHFIYKVEREGMSVRTLGRYYAVSVDDLKTWNPWMQTEKLQLGEELNIYKTRESVIVHKTRRGDSLWKLARRYHSTVRDVKRWNQLVGSRIYPGNSLIVKMN